MQCCMDQDLGGGGGGRGGGWWGGGAGGTNHLNPLYTGRLFHCYMLSDSICHLRGFRAILSLLFYFCWEILSADLVDPNQMPHYVASYLGLQCLPMTLLQVSGKNGRLI